MRKPIALRTPDMDLSLRFVRPAKRGDLAQATTLLDAGADHNAVDARSQTAAHYAAMDGHLEIVRLLRGRRADLDKRESEGRTPFLGE